MLKVIYKFSKMKLPYQMSKVVNSLLKLEVHLSYTIKVRNYHTNCRLMYLLQLYQL